MNFFGRFGNFFLAALLMVFVFSAVSCKSQAAVSGGKGAGSDASSPDDGTIVITGDPAGMLLSLDFKDPGKPIPFTLNESSNIPGCLMEYQNGKLHVSNQMTGETPWLQTNPILNQEIQDFFWQFEYTPNYNTWDSTWFSFRVAGKNMNQCYHLHFIGQNGLDVRDRANVARNNDNAQVHLVTGNADREELVASTRLNWYGPGRPVMIRIISEDDNCKIWLWRKGRGMPDNPTFQFLLEHPGLYKGDFMIVSWESDFLLDDMVIFNRAKP